MNKVYSISEVKTEPAPPKNFQNQLEVNKEVHVSLSEKSRKAVSESVDITKGKIVSGDEVDKDQSKLKMLNDEV